MTFFNLFLFVFVVFLFGMIRSEPSRIGAKTFGFLLFLVFRFFGTCRVF